LDRLKYTYTHCLYGVPFLAYVMMGKYELLGLKGKPRFAYERMIIPSVGNLLMDYNLLLCSLDWGMGRCAWATTIGYFLCFANISLFLWFQKNSELKLKLPFWTSIDPSKGNGALVFVYLVQTAVISLIILVDEQYSLWLGGKL